MTESNVRARLLVVDDDAGMAATLKDILAASGYEVAVAHSGAEAIESVRERQPAGILMDIRMPEMDGVEAFRHTRRLSPRSFVIFMTAFSTSTLVADAHREGAVEVVPKPLDIERLLGLIETAVEVPRASP